MRGGAMPRSAAAVALAASLVGWMAADMAVAAGGGDSVEVTARSGSTSTGGERSNGGSQGRQVVRVDGEKEDEGELIGPWTYAPDRYIVAPRDPYGFRKKKSLLAKAEHREVTYSDEELYRRRMAAYGQSAEPPPAPRQYTPPVGVTAPQGLTPVGIAKRIFLAIGAGMVLTVAAFMWLKSRKGVSGEESLNTVPLSARRRLPKHAKRQAEERKSQSASGASPATEAGSSQKKGGLRAPGSGGLRKPKKGGPKFM
jgi:hypothetical protein